MKIDANLAVIKTAQVEIKALTVGGKQVTLAVFRQLDQAKFIDYESQKLNGMAWGRLNYHPYKCAGSDHIHIVWQDGNTIYSDLIDAHLYKPKNSIIDDFHGKSDSYCQNIETLLKVLDKESVAKTETQPNESYFDGFRTTEELLDVWVENGSILPSDKPFSRYSNAAQLTEKGVREFQKLFWEFKENNRQTKIEKTKIETFHNSTYEQLQNLDLLFIAV